MKVLVTGGTGFVGRNIVPYLRSKFDVSLNKYNLLSFENARKIVEEATPDVIVHCAGKVGGIGANKADPAGFFYDNMLMGMNIIEVAKVYNVKKFILLGTVCSYPKFTPIPFKEEYLWQGFPEETNAPYGIAKRALMTMLDSYHKQYGLEYTTLVPTNMYGPYDHVNFETSHVIPALMLKIEMAKKFYTDLELWGTGNASREFLYAEDLAYAIESAIHTTYNGYLNIGTGKETKIKDLVEILCKLMNYNGVVRYNQNYPDGQPRRCLNTDLAKSVLGFSAKTNLNEGLERTVKWYYDNIRNLY